MCSPNKVVSLSRRRKFLLLIILCGFLIYLVPIPNLRHDDDALDSSLPEPTLMDFIRRINCSDPKSYKDPLLQRDMKQFLSEDAILERTKNCDEYFRLMPTNAFHNVSVEEWKLRFGVAHSLHTQIGIFEMYLALHYRPVDSHCIHLDLKASDKVKSAVRSLVRCYKLKFPGSMFMIAKLEIPVYWGWDSVLEADLVCLRLLLEHDTRWQYFMNPAGTELPLVSYRAFRRKLVENNLNNVIQFESDAPKHRQGHPYKMVRTGTGEFDFESYNIRQCEKEPSPIEAHVYKASKNVILNRTFAHFLIHHPVAIEYYNWIIDTFVPDEHFYSVLATLEIKQLDSNLYDVQQVMTDHKMKDFAKVCFRKSLWIYDENGIGCAGEVVRWICHLAVEDLPKVQSSGCMYANKFDVAVDISAVMCQVKQVMYLTQVEARQSVDEYSEMAKNGP
ncbi:hypothetical protein TCAL_10160 [Tigriopus californicus]|uniref:Uncharacterized protein n=1 Tax=Tigriopus californicus TaxID=6832 RepID=A0A553P7N2_TIGCA|nr:beta-1,3-galactosyl-O-glycosyl-glycoprotein beta-1,6-N-acetylglucosaminyltransferase 3-like [Tigriopus californicus]XP_059079344.1 beta-1,3-galactosyl-O-glycosyl-glycoprotein beta-1,6-N-acetylglucosaminyltransferase 3-like [Tigriopus californicus]TRY73679.1 hypothetical protein TCAL_10160 [Tigriopus californicus]|eukprot:TCALIF_10160-PA protein Name:"Similar to gcnt3 Beta-1,3-galactosyl-O-glycosyl-glycoprotein beta-1,6-N-acetylglucosaminyltransferase 3 (Xenopus laevis)" AED:0.12 eAED:0.12 QI:0/1/0/1/1/1/2/0/445